MDLDAIQERTLADIDSYRHESSEGTIGIPWSEPRMRAGIERLRSSLVSPYWVDVVLRDTLDQIYAKIPILRRCAAVAMCNKAVFLVFDPSADEYLLAQQCKDHLESFGVMGDAVGCFLAL